MKKLFTILCAVMITLNLSAQTDAGTFYMALGNSYTPLGENQNGAGLPMFTNSSGMSFGSEWITGITADGDDEDPNGNDYWDKDEKDKLGNFNIAGQFGFFVTDGLLTGLGIEYASISNTMYMEYDWDGDGQDDEFTDKYSTSSLALSPFIKYYINAGDNALFFNTSYTFGSINTQSEYEYDFSSSPNESDDDEGEPYFTSRIEIGGGMAFFLTESISLEPSVNFALNKYTQERDMWNGTTYDDQDYQVSTNAFYFKIAASMYLGRY